MANREYNNINKIYSNKRFYKKELMIIYENYKHTVDEDLVELCDYINYNFDDMNTIFSCSGHHKRDAWGYLSIKYKKIDFFAKIIPLIPVNQLGFTVYFMRNNYSWFNIYFKPKYIKEFVDMMFKIFSNYEKIMKMDTLPAYIIRGKKLISYDIDFVNWNDENYNEV